MFSRAEITGYDSISPEVEEVPLRARLMLPLHLHGPHKPANGAGPALIRVYLGQEEVLQEINMSWVIVGKVSIVISADRVEARLVRSVVTSLEILLTLGGRHAELPGEHGQLTGVDVLLVSAGLGQMQVPAIVTLHPVIPEALIMMSVHYKVLKLVCREAAIEVSPGQGSHIHNYSCLLRCEVFPDGLITLRVKVSETSLLQGCATFIATNVRFIQKSDPIESVNGKNSSINPLSHCLSNLLIDTHSSVKVGSVLGVGIIHPVRLSPSAAIVIAIL